MNPILARHGSSDFNLFLWSAVKDIAADVADVLQHNLVALILGGGYGRGEGAVWITDAGEEKPYNDLDFTLVVHRSRHRSLDALQRISTEHGRRLGIDIDFSRPLTPYAIANLPHIMMWHDLLAGHVVVAGPPDYLQLTAPDELRQPLPKIEGLRLLLNRGAGLLQAILINLGIERDHDFDFRRRNLQKLNLALGDAILISGQKYTANCTGRDKLLSHLLAQINLPIAEELEHRYQQALQFKFMPATIDLDQPDLQKLLQAAGLYEQILLFIETDRLGITFHNLESYVRWTGKREPSYATSSEIPKNVIRNLKLRRLALEHPRERLYRELPLLLHPEQYSNEQFRLRSSDFLLAWHQFN